MMEDMGANENDILERSVAVFIIHVHSLCLVSMFYLVLEVDSSRDEV